MAKRNVLKPFKLNLADGVVEFDTGTQEIDDELVDHWFVKAHLEPEIGDESEEDEKARLLAELATLNITVGANIRLEKLRVRVQKARTEGK